MKETLYQRIKQWLMRSIYLQLYISLVASPILLYWGLPLSVASPAGNILFNPLLTIFLFFSSLVFFSELLHIPNGILIWLLDKSTDLFDYCANFGRQYWLIGFAKPALPVLWLIPIATLLVVHHRQNRRNMRGIILLTTLSFVICIYLMYVQRPKSVQKIPCNNGFLTLVHINKKTILIDPGVLGARISAPSFIQYTLVPTIIKTTGSLTIDILILAKCNLMTLVAAQKLTELLTINALYMPACNGSMEENEKQKYEATLKQLQETTTISFIVGPLHLIAPQHLITITPQQKTFNYKGLHYPSLSIEGTVDGTPFNGTNIHTNKQTTKKKERG